MTTGPTHWDIMFKSKALDNQVFTIGYSPARNYSSTYISYGHSLIVSLFGEVLCKMDENENIIICEIDLDNTYSIRDKLPLLKHRRHDLYELKEK